MEEIRNKVEESGIINLDLIDLLPKESILEIDMKDFLWQGLILKEKEFRLALKETDWSIYKGFNVAVHCSEDAIIQSWAYMLLGAHLEGEAKSIYFGSKSAFEQDLLLQNIDDLNVDDYMDQRIIVKGCGDKFVSNAAYLKIAYKLKPIAKSIMFGEACSAVPVWKNNRNS